MTRITQTVLAVTAVLAAFSGIAQAGRVSDYPSTQHNRAAIERAADTDGVAYTGRPNDTLAVVPARSEERAEFAVMEVHNDGAVRGAGANYGSRPMDNLIR